MGVHFALLRISIVRTIAIITITNVTILTTSMITLVLSVGDEGKDEVEVPLGITFEVDGASVESIFCSTITV